MYIPASFQQTDRETLFRFMELNSFAIVISRVGDEETASHLPLLVDRERGPHGTVVGHMARANDQWRTAADQQVLVIYHGPHAYVSPSWVEVRNAVPTWNYQAVHAYGRLRVIDDPGPLLAIVRRMVDHYEGGRRNPWSLSVPDPEFVDKLLASIVGFEIEVERLEGKWKLSQNHPVERREQIAEGLLTTGRPEDRQIAEAMRG